MADTEKTEKLKRPISMAGNRITQFREQTLIGRANWEGNHIYLFILQN